MQRNWSYRNLVERLKLWFLWYERLSLDWKAQKIQRRWSGSLHQRSFEFFWKTRCFLFESDFESVFIEIDKEQLGLKKNVIVGPLYRPPGADIKYFNDKMSILLGDLRKENKICYLIGEFNTNLLNHDSHGLTGDFYDLMTSNSFLPLISRPTRITATSATLIDNVFTNYLENCNESFQGLLVTDVTDHYPVFHSNCQITSQESDVFIIKRSYSVKNKNAFLDAIRGTHWNEIYNNSGTQKCFDLFHGKLIKLLNKYFPKVRMKKRYNNKKPWLSEAMRNSIKHKNKLYYAYKRVQSVHNEMLYKSYKSNLHKLMKMAEKQYYHSLLLQNKENMRKSWGIIKSIINKNKKPVCQSKFKLNTGEVTSDKFIISKQFNDFFINIGPSLSKSIPHVNCLPQHYMGEAVKECLFLDPVSITEIKEIINDLKNTAIGYDDISATILKLAVEYVVKYFSRPTKNC